MASNYEIIREISNGGIADAVVNIVRDIRNQELRTRKRLTFPTLADSRDAMAEYGQVRRNLGVDNFRHVANVHDCFEDQKMIFCISQYYAQSLRSRINSRLAIAALMVFFPKAQIKAWMTELCLGLQEIFQQNLLHRNLKPENIFIAGNNVLKIGDLGLTVVSNIFREDIMKRTPVYISPEVVDGNAPSQKTDIWSIGCVCFEIINLEAAFDSIEALNAYRNNFPLKPMQGEEICPVLCDVVQKMLEVVFNDRPTITQCLAFIEAVV